MTQNWTSNVKFNWIFSKLYLLYIYIYIFFFFCQMNFFLVIKKRLINIKLFKLSLPLILYIVLDI